MYENIIITWSGDDFVECKRPSHPPDGKSWKAAQAAAASSLTLWPWRKSTALRACDAALKMARLSFFKKEEEAQLPPEAPRIQVASDHRTNKIDLLLNSRTFHF